MVRALAEITQLANRATTIYDERTMVGPVLYHEMVLGARRTQVTGIILGEALGVTVAGLIVGLAGAAVMARYLKSLMFGVPVLSVSTFLVVSALLALVAAVSAYLPARRAMKVDPIVALRYE